MNKALILVEGPTEEKFVKEIIGPHLWQSGVSLVPTIVVTKRVKKGPDFKGGIVSYAKFRKDLVRLLGDTSAVCVTTMIDLYGLPGDFPCHITTVADPYTKVEALEQAFEQDIDHNRFLGHLTLHEFEGLLFTSPKEIAKALNAPEREYVLETTRSEFNTPEEIDDNPETIPSRRIEQSFPKYQKTFHGSVISRRIGLQAIRTECPHFNKWITRLEKLG